MASSRVRIWLNTDFTLPFLKYSQRIWSCSNLIILFSLTSITSPLAPVSDTAQLQVTERGERTLSRWRWRWRWCVKRWRWWIIYVEWGGVQTILRERGPPLYSEGGQRLVWSVQQTASTRVTTSTSTQRAPDITLSILMCYIVIYNIIIHQKIQYIIFIQRMSSWSSPHTRSLLPTLSQIHLIINNIISFDASSPSGESWVCPG